MDTPHGRQSVPAAEGRLHGGDRSGLGDKGWAEVGDDNVGHPEGANVPPSSRGANPPSPLPDRAS